MCERLTNENGNAWIDVDLDAVFSNLAWIKNRLSQDTQIMAVVKANAYGLGMCEVALALETVGVQFFGVTHLWEAQKLRRSGLSAPLVLFAPLLPDQYSLAVKEGVQITISQSEQLMPLQACAAKEKSQVSIQLKMETGMGRTGIWPKDLPAFIAQLAACPDLKLAGAYSHLAKAADDAAFSNTQFRRFQEGIAILEEAGLHIPIKHMVNSAGLVNYPHMHLNMVRVGNLLFGQVPSGVAASGIRDPWQPKARVLQIREVPPKWPIGYGSTFMTKRESRLAVLPIGLADGFNVSPRLSYLGYVDLFKRVLKEILSFHGIGPYKIQVTTDKQEACPIVGRVGMQLSLADVTRVSLKEGDTVSFHLPRVQAPLHLPRNYIKSGVSS